MRWVGGGGEGGGLWYKRINAPWYDITHGHTGELVVSFTRTSAPPPALSTVVSHTSSYLIWRTYTHMCRRRCEDVEMWTHIYI